LLNQILDRIASLFDKVDLPVPVKEVDEDKDPHEYRPPRTKGVKDSRSPCPALNTLANHGYLYVSFSSLNDDALTYNPDAAPDRVVTSGLTNSYKLFKKAMASLTLSQRSLRGAALFSCSNGEKCP
jgi:hypothetical protein